MASALSWSILLSFFLILTPHLTLAAAPICTQLYLGYLPLSTYAPAQAYCTARYPLPACPKITTTLTTTTTVAATVVGATITATVGTSIVTRTVATSTQTVITSTATLTVAGNTVTAPAITTTVKTTSTQTDAQANTVTQTITNTITETGTTTATVTVPPSNQKRVAVPRAAAVVKLRPADVAAASASAAQKREATGENDFLGTLRRREDERRDVQVKKRTGDNSAMLPGLYTILTLQAPSIQSTACSCIEVPPVCTTASVTTKLTRTTTTTATATTSVKATVTSSVTETKTVSTRTTITSTVATTVTPKVSVTSTITVTANLANVITATVTTATTTTTLTTVTVSVTALPSCVSGAICNQGNNFVSNCGQAYSTDGSGTMVIVADTSSDQDCLQACSDDQSCNIFDWDSSTNTCYIYETTTPGIVPGSFIDLDSAWGFYSGGC